MDDIEEAMKRVNEMTMSGNVGAFPKAFVQVDTVDGDEDKDKELEKDAETSVLFRRSDLK